MRQKISIFIFLLILSFSAHAVTILPVPESFWEKILRCTWHVSCYRHKLGVSITTIAGTDTLSGSRGTINTNFSNLNSGKIENATTSVAAITTLSNLVTTGALSSGSLASGFTTVTVGLGGTGSTTLASNQVLLGSTTNAINVVAGLGTSGQFLTSGGAGAPPTWTTGTTDLTQNNVWTSASTTFLNLVNIRIGTTTHATSTTLRVSDVASTSQLSALSFGVGVATTTSKNVEISGDVQIDGKLNVSSDPVGAIKFLTTPTSAIDTTVLTNGTFADVDITSTTTPDVARFVILNVILDCTHGASAGSSGCLVRFRQNGSSATSNLPRVSEITQVVNISNRQTSMIIVPVDSGEIFEYDFDDNLTGDTSTAQQLQVSVVGFIE